MLFTRSLEAGGNAFCRFVGGVELIGHGRNGILESSFGHFGSEPDKKRCGEAK
jgi:hypothetical protein